MSQTHKRFCHWNDRELNELSAGIQEYGFADVQKLSSHVKTKSPTQIKSFIKEKINELQKNKKKLSKKTGKKPKTSWSSVTTPEDMKDWSNIRKWKKILENQISSSAVKRDYSRIVIKNLCQKFYDEAEATTNPQVLDVKSIYKFMLECVSGQVPAQLPIKESAYVLVLLRVMKNMFQTQDFKEEINFIQDFQKPYEFVPCEVKDEFKKKKEYPSKSIPIPIDLFQNLMCHRQVVNSFNPFGVPVWMLKKEQKSIEELLQTTGSDEQPSTSGEQKK